ncbi:MAG: AIR synthase related protein [Fusobacteria bacterium]|nr:AIR synthase related protein [Fusobacteriota bacterium]
MMKNGKLTSQELAKLLKIKKLNQRVIVGCEVGEDAAVMDFRENYCVLATDPITGVRKHIGKFAFHVNCNDIIASGGKPVALLVTILAPSNSTLNEIHEVMDEIYCEAEKYGVDIIGGHTEFTDAVNQLIVSCTAIGESPKKILPLSKNFKKGDIIYVTKTLGIEWTLIKILDEYEAVKSVLSENEYLEGLRLIDNLTVIPEGEILSNYAVSSMHDITEGGVMGALGEMFQESLLNFEVYEENFNMLEITKKLIEYYSEKIETVISSGSLIFMCSEQQGYEIEKAFNHANIKLTAIGIVI